MHRLKEHGFVKLLPGALSPTFCNDLINSVETWTPALINDNGDQVVDLSIRKCSRFMVKNAQITDHIWQIIKDEVKFGTINPMLRFLKYEVGDYFKPHYDSDYVDENGKTSKITIQIYLNEEFEGGETIFYNPENEDHILYRHKPKTGDILLFEQEAFLHSGDKITFGTKYCVRTEMMY